MKFNKKLNCSHVKKIFSRVQKMNLNENHMYHLNQNKWTFKQTKDRVFCNGMCFVKIFETLDLYTTETCYIE